LFDDTARRLGIEHRGVLAARKPGPARGDELGAGGARSEAFVGKMHGQRVALRKRRSEAARGLRHRLIVAIAGQRQTHHQRLWLPSFQQGIAGRPVRAAVGMAQHRDGTGRAGDALADGDADTAQAIVEAEHDTRIRHGPRHRSCG
jgi:hypothetical protein